MMVHRQDGEIIKYKKRKRDKVETQQSINYHLNIIKQSSNIVIEKTKGFSAAL